MEGNTASIYTPDLLRVVNGLQACREVVQPKRDLRTDVTKARKAANKRLQKESRRAIPERSPLARDL